MANYGTGVWEFIKPKTIWNHKIWTPKAKNLQIQGKKLLITGGSKGIGLTICKQVAKQGIAKITIMARNVKIMEEAIDKIKKYSHWARMGGRA